jgi:hypothetical protein
VRGFAQDIEPAYGEPAPFERQVVGVVAASDFPDPALIRNTIEKGQAHDPHTVWVVRDKDTMVTAALEKLGLDFVRSGLNPDFKVEIVCEGPLERGKRARPKLTLSDTRRDWRLGELVNCCSLVLVFAKPDLGSLSDFAEIAARDRKVRIITRGKLKAKKPRKGRKID